MLIDGVSRELVEEANAGVYVEPENPKEFARIISTYVNDENKIHEQGENGYIYAKSNFDRKILAKKYLDYIKSIKK